MPTSYLDSSDAPDLEIRNWLSWSEKELLRMSGDTYIAALMGIARSGDIQIIYKPIVVRKDESDEPIAIIGNASDKKSEPSFVYVETCSLGNFHLIEKMEAIPQEIRPPTSLPPSYLAKTAWENTQNLGMCLPPITAPIFFGQKPIEGSVYDDDFPDRMRAISEQHGNWAALMVEIFSQQEQDDSDLDAIVDRLAKPKSKDASPSNYVLDGFNNNNFPETPYFCIYQLRNPAKWKEGQDQLRAYFVKHPSPTRMTQQVYQNSAEETSDDDSTPVQGEERDQARTNRNGGVAVNPPPSPSANAGSGVSFAPAPSTAYYPPPQWWTAPQLVPPSQQQNIIVESRADKAREQEANLNTIMLSLFLAGGSIDWDEGKITDVKIPTPTQEYKNILLQPPTIRPIQAGNILLTVFTTAPDTIEARFSPLFSKLSMEFFPKNLVTSWLNANFQKSNLDSLSFETNAITVLSFVSQNDTERLTAVRLLEENEKNERSYDFLDVHKTKAKATIEGLGRIEGIDCIVKICANICGFIRSFFDIEKGKRPIIYDLCVKTIDCITHQEFNRWHAVNAKQLAHLPYIFLNMMQHVFVQQAKFAANTLNTNKIEVHGPTVALVTKQVDVSIKYLARFFKKMDDHVAEDTVPTAVPRFTPHHAKPGIMGALEESVANTAIEAGNKKKAEDSPPGTPTREKKAKKARLKPTGAADQTKKGMFHGKKGVSPSDLFPTGLESAPCAFFCFQDKKCTKPKSTCPRPHVTSWKNIKPGDQPKILKHFANTGNGWLDAETFKRHEVEIAPEFAYLLGDANGPKEKSA